MICEHFSISTVVGVYPRQHVDNTIAALKMHKRQLYIERKVLSFDAKISVSEAFVFLDPLCNQLVYVDV